MDLGIRKVNLAVLLASTFVVSSMLMIGLAPHASASSRNCGYVQLGGSTGGQVVSTGVKCTRAKKMVRKCAIKGQAPRGWSAFKKGFNSTFYLKHGRKRIVTTLGGGTTPGLDNCLN